jgi:hypothetical protein
MQTLFSELGKRIPERWITHYLVPGLLWIAVSYLVNDWFGVVKRAEALVKELNGRPTAIFVLCLLILGGAMVVGGFARMFAGGVQALWLGEWTWKWLTDRRYRHRRWALGRASVPEVYLPQRPTWIGDQVRILDARIQAQYGLYLALAWPRLWQLSDTETRKSVADARERFDRASRLAGWATMYAILVFAWLPMIVFGVVFFAYSVYRGRQTVVLFVETVETVVDLRHRALAETLGHVIAPGTQISQQVADAVNDQLNKGATPQPQPDVAAGFVAPDTR